MRPLTGCGMQYAYALLGLAFIILVGALIFLLPDEATIQETDIINNQKEVMLTLTSSVFEHNGTIPLKYTCDGDDVNPPLAISDVPENAKSLVLIMDDPDVPAQVNPAQMWDHWVIFNLPVTGDTLRIGEATTPLGAGGNNSWGRTGYGGPCPPTEFQPTEHRYFFKLYALDTMLDLPDGVMKAQIEREMEGHIIEQAELVGRFDRANK